MFGDQFILPRRLPFSHLGLLASMATQVSWDTACRSMCLLNQHDAPNCQLLWFQLLPMGNCTQGPLKVPMYLRHLSAHPIEVPAKAIVGQVASANQVPQLSSHWRPQVDLPMACRKDVPGSIEFPGPEGVAGSRTRTD